MPTTQPRRTREELAQLGSEIFERRQLRQVHQQALEAAAAKACRSVAFPAISTGAYRFPLAEAAPNALRAAEEHLRGPQPVDLVRFVLFKPGQLEVFRAALKALAGE